MLYLTYKSKLHDGFGAQYQRILGVYSICKEYNYVYIHTPLEDIEYQGLQALEKNANDRAYVDECNKRYCLQSTAPALQMYDQIISKDLTVSQLQTLAETGQNILVQYQFPYVISDKVPDIYRHVRGLYMSHLPKNKTFTIGLHVRRGELNVVSSDRLLPNSHYISIAQCIIKLLEANHVDYIIELYTEVANSTIKVTPHHVGIKKRIHKPKLITPESSNIHEFDILPCLQKYINTPMYETFDRMINCDILVASKSSFSACAAYLKNEGITVYYPFWHSMNTKDVSCKEKEMESKILGCIKEFKTHKIN